VFLIEIESVFVLQTDPHQLLQLELLLILPGRILILQDQHRPHVGKLKARERKPLPKLQQENLLQGIKT